MMELRAFPLSFQSLSNRIHLHVPSTSVFLLIIVVVVIILIIIIVPEDRCSTRKNIAKQIAANVALRQRPCNNKKYKDYIKLSK